MRHHLLSSPITTTMSSCSTHSKNPKLKKTRSNPNPNPNCHHSASATLDLLILLLVLFSGTFLISSYFSYTLHSLSLLHFHFHFHFDIAKLSVFLLLLFFTLSYFMSGFCFRQRKCGNVGCKGLRRAMEFDLRMQSEECLKFGGKVVVEVDQLPWKGGGEGNKDYECLRNELRKMAPVNGRAVLVFQNKCGCPFAKLEEWSFKRGRKNKKTLALKGGGDHG